MKQRGLEVIQEQVLFHQNQNPYQADFDEQEQEDIIQIRIPDPSEAYYYDENGTEKVQLKEIEPEIYRPTQDLSGTEVFVLDPEEILKEAQDFTKS